jgi:hypothetical protein
LGEEARGAAQHVVEGGSPPQFVRIAVARYAAPPVADGSRLETIVERRAASRWQARHELLRPRRRRTALAASAIPVLTLASAAFLRERDRRRAERTWGPSIRRGTRVLPVGVGSPVGVASPVSFLPGDIGVSLRTTGSLVRFSELAPICAPLLSSTPLASTHRKGYEQNHENDRDRDDGNDDAGAHLFPP